MIGAAIEVHKALGPGFLESVYERALCKELALRGLSFERQVPMDVRYKGEVVGELRLDILVGGRLVVELKAVDGLAPVHMQQTVAYLKQVKEKVGLLLNFNVVKLNEGGIHRVIFTG